MRPGRVISEALGLPCASLLGHSCAAVIACGTALTAPGRVRSLAFLEPIMNEGDRRQRAQSLVLLVIGTPSGPERPLVKEGRQLLHQRFAQCFW